MKNKKLNLCLDNMEDNSVKNVGLVEKKRKFLSFISTVIDPDINSFNVVFKKHTEQVCDQRIETVFNSTHSDFHLKIIFFSLILRNLALSSPSFW